VHAPRTWAEIGALVGQRSLKVTSDTYTHVLVDSRELDYAALLTRPKRRRFCSFVHVRARGVRAPVRAQRAKNSHLQAASIPAGV
jgi:hypothetical protein